MTRIATRRGADPAPAPFPPIGEQDAAPLADQVYQRIRDAIGSGVLPPRGRLSERDLSAALGVSTSPVKAALGRLEREGMVVTQPRRGTWVAFAPEKLHEMGLIRASLEGVAARLAASRISPAQIEALAGIIAELEAATGLHDTRILAEANERYHALVLAAADNAFLTNAVSALRGYYVMTRNRMQTARLEPLKAMAEHRAIFAALSAHDGDAAETAMRAHIARSVDTLWREAAEPAAAPRRKRAAR